MPRLPWIVGVLVELAFLLSSANVQAERLAADTPLYSAIDVTIAHEDPGLVDRTTGPLDFGSRPSQVVPGQVLAMGHVDTTSLSYILDSWLFIAAPESFTVQSSPFKIRRTYDPPGFDPPIVQTLENVTYTVTWEWAPGFKLTPSGRTAPVDPFLLQGGLDLKPALVGRIRVTYSGGELPLEYVGPWLELKEAIRFSCGQSPASCSAVVGPSLDHEIQIPIYGLFADPTGFIEQYQYWHNGGSYYQGWFPVTQHRVNVSVGTLDSISPDADLDGILTSAGDNCPGVANADQADTDSDGFGDACDRCREYPTTNNGDWDGNGIGDDCECGDQTYDGSVNVLDLIAINRAVFTPTLATPLCDANFDGLCNVQDIVRANQKIFGRPAYCSRYPPPPGQ